ncbi:transcriptional regulator [Streptomyces caatingaensis]|uniref:Transcriptional regulator n=1 Tax=Streptomyces caatingaensis TaxID=1678637 RepID=A0A0K9XJ65_9ACTN|nr:transcriptional regulator [Streptomyces caatingaensis]KNB53439.1 transcriptional regulator [Streptomyces caatingaensis]
MARTAREVLEDAAREPAPGADDNPVVPLIARGGAPRAVLAALALEQHHVIAADLISYRHLATRAAGSGSPAAAAFFAALADGEETALCLLGPFAAACGLDEAAVRAHEPALACQAYPACTAMLALGAEPADVVVALSVNFATWGGFCREVARALRSRYGFPDEAYGFFDLFARPDPEGEARALAAVEEGLADGRLTERLAWRYGRLLQGYEAMFWRGVGEARPDA